MNVKLKVLRRNKEKGYSDRIYYYFLLTLNICLGIEIINSNIQFHINLQILFFVQKQNMNSSIYARMHKFFFPVLQVSNKTIYIFQAPVPQKQAKIRKKKSHNKTFLMPYIIFKPVSSENMKTSSRRPVIGKGFAINVILNRCNSI